MLEPRQRSIAFPYVLSDATWETSLSLISTAAVPANLTLRAFNSQGQLVRETVVKLGARGFKSATVKQLFGSAAGSARWVKATSDQSLVLGYLRMERIGTRQFSSIPASPVVPADSVGQASGAREKDRLRSIGLALETARIRMIEVAGGVQVLWPADWSPVAQLVPGRFISPGIVVRAVAGTQVHTREELLKCISRINQTGVLEIVLANEPPIRIDNARRLLATEAIRKLSGRK